MCGTMCHLQRRHAQEGAVHDIVDVIAECRGWGRTTCFK